MSTKKQHKHSSHSSFNMNAFIGQIQQLMDEGEYGVEKLAIALNMSVQTFRRRIRVVTGLSPLVYLTARRMEKAVALLSENHSMPITSIASRCGFAECSSFTHAFRRFYGISPVQYREKHKNQVNS